MWISRLKEWVSDKDLEILFTLGFIAWSTYQLHSEGMSFLAITFVIPLAWILGYILLALLLSLFHRATETPLIDYWGGGKQAVDVDFSSPLNRGVLEYLMRRSRQGRIAGLESASPTSVKKPLTKTRTRFRIGVRLWDGLAVSLPVDCRWIVCGAPALVHPQTGVLFGLGIGAVYCLWLTDADMESALQAGASTEIRWSDGSTLDLASQFGSGWVFGSWLQEELKWCRAAYEELGRVGAAPAGRDGRTHRHLRP